MSSLFPSLGIGALVLFATQLDAETLVDWEFETTPGFLADSSPNNRDLTIVDASVFAQSSTTSTDLGLSAEIADGGYAAVADALEWTTTTMTVEVLFTASATSGSTQVLVSQWNGSSNQRSWAIGTNGGKVRFLQSSNGSSSVTNDTLSVIPNKDYYLAIRLNGNSGEVLLKNLTDDTEMERAEIATLSSVLNSTAPLSVGSTSQPSSPFTGKIGRIRIEDAVLADEDMLYLPPEVVVPVYDEKIDGYKGLWFDLGQNTTYGSKYSGGLATYTAKHRPVAVYAPGVDKTFFTYGGTRSANEKHLLIMASEFDHSDHSVPKPTIVMDKNGVDDPHDNATIQIDQDGYVYVVVSGRSTIRRGFFYKSTEPYSTDAFIRLGTAGGFNFTYPQIWYLDDTPVEGNGQFVHFFTRYTGGRELFVGIDADATATAQNVTRITNMGGSYQASLATETIMGTAFNRHPGGNVDQRTDLYYVQSTDNGATWTTVDGAPLQLPLTGIANDARVIDYASQGRLVYMKDLDFDENDYPVITYVTSADYRPGPQGEPRLVQVTRWNGTAWVTTHMPTEATSQSTVIHNYSTGSLDIRDNSEWSMVFPTSNFPVPAEGSVATGGGVTSAQKRYWGQGGEMEIWTSSDAGTNWTKANTITRGSSRKHGYARIPQDGADPFHYFWGDGNPDAFTEVHLYFGTKSGDQYWKLPYEMTEARANPVPQKEASLRWRERYATPDQVTVGTGLFMNDNPDEDDAINLLEYAFGTNPFDSEDRPQLKATAVADGSNIMSQVSFTLNGEATDLRTSIQMSDTMEGDDWEIATGLSEYLQTPLPEGLVNFVYKELLDPDFNPKRFYRMLVEELTP